MKGRKQGHHTSDFEEYSRFLKRYAGARKEARLLRRKEVWGAQGAHGPDHPWVEASLRAKAGTAASPTAPKGPSPHRSRLPWIIASAALLVIALGGAAFFSARTPLPAGGPPAPPQLEVWHDLHGEELRALLAVAARLSGEEARFEPVFRPDLPGALRRGVLLGETPALAIVEHETARSLAGAGVLIPIAGDAYYTLAAPAPWNRPLVLVAFPSRAGAPIDELIREFARALSEAGAPGG